MSKYIPVGELLTNEDANYRTEHFQDPESLEEFVNKLRINGIDGIGAKVDGDDWDGELYLTIPQKITVELLVLIASEQPDECRVETEDGVRFIMLWWD